MLKWLASQWESRSSTAVAKMVAQLKQYGLAGVLAYGLLNTAYYSSVFLFAWFVVTPSPGSLGFRAAAGRVTRVLATVWAGSQLTKLPRAAGALLLAPTIDRFLLHIEKRFNFKSREKAFLWIVCLCIGFALTLFGLVITVWS